MSTAQNKAMLRRFYDEILSQGKIEVMDEIFATGCVCYLPGGVVHRGLERLKQTVAVYRTALPDMQFTVEDQIAEADKVGISTTRLYGFEPFKALGWIW